MKGIVSILAIAVVLTLTCPFTALAVDPFSVNTSLLYADFPSEGGFTYLDLYVQNTLGIPQTITVSLWDKYTTPDEGASWIDPLWIASITPNQMTLDPGQNALFSVKVVIDSSVEEVPYITWFKVSNGTSLDKPITVWIRKGKAVPYYDFALTTGSYYYLRVTGYPAYLKVDDPSDSVNSPIGVRSKSKTDTRFYAEVETPGYGDVITDQRVRDSESRLFYGKYDEVGNIYQSITSDEAGWFEIGDDSNPCSRITPLKLGPYSVGFIPWSLTIPDEAPDGHYWAWIHIKPAESGSQTVTIDYVSKVYITIDRETPEKKPWYQEYKIPLIVCGGILVSALGLVVVLRAKGV